jgi:hypothetical protein
MTRAPRRNAASENNPARPKGRQPRSGVAGRNWTEHPDAANRGRYGHKSDDKPRSKQSEYDTDDSQAV